MPSVTLRGHTDAYTAEDSPNSNFGPGVKLRVRAAGSGLRRFSYLFFPRPFPRGSNVVEATLRLSAKGSWGAGSRTITVKRIEDSWKENRITFNNAPAVDGTHSGSLVVSNLADEEEVEIDVTDLFQDVSDGDPYHGVRVELSEDAGKSFFASDAPRDGTTPKLDIQWGGAPYPPSNLSPSSGRAIDVAAPRLRWDFHDTRGDTDQAYSQIQISDSPDFSSPLYDSTKVANTRHSWGLAGEYSVPADSERFWRAKVWDGTNLESGWSNTVRFQRLSKGVLTITNPPIAPDNIVPETTPPIAWTFTGRTQERVRLRLVEVDDVGKTRELFEFPEQKTTDTSITIPRGIIGPRPVGTHFRADLWVWDTQDREAISGDPDFVFAQRNFRYERDGTPDPIATLTATLFEPNRGPGVVLNFTRTVEPDFFALLNNTTDEQIFDRIDPDDVRTGAGTYSLTLWRLPPRVLANLEIEAVVVDAGAHKHSDGNPTVNVTTAPEGIWLIDETTTEAVKVLGADDAGLTIGISGEVLRPISNRRKAKIIDSFGGYEGTFSGEIETDAARDLLLKMVGSIYDELRVVAANLNIPVELDLDFSINPTPTPGIGDRYEVSFSVYQAGEFFDIEGGA